MQCASVLAPERGNALLATSEDASLLAVELAYSALLAETPANGLHQLAGDHGPNQMPVYGAHPWVRWKMGRRPSSDLRDGGTPPRHRSRMV